MRHANNGKPWRRRVARLVWLALVAYALWCAALFAFQRRMLFPGAWMPAPANTLESIADAELLHTPGGVEALLLLPTGPERPFGGGTPRGASPTSDTAPTGTPPVGPAPLVVFTHGNGELIDSWPESFGWLRDRGYAMLLVEYPGYGRSPGRPSQRAIVDNLLTAYDEVTAREDIDAGRTYAFGRSLGGGPACALAGARPVTGLVLQSAFTSVRAFAAGYRVPGWLVRDPFDNLRAVARLDVPVLVFHGNRDDIVPFPHGRALVDAAAHGSFVEQDCAHNDCPPSWRLFEEQLMPWLESAPTLNAEPNPTPPADP